MLLSEKNRHETARFSRCSRRRGGDRAARRACATARADTPHRCAHGLSPGRWATTNADDVRRHAAELAALAPDVLVAGTGTATVAPLLQATRTVPIVFVVVIDPVGAGFVASSGTAGRQCDWVHDVRIRHEWKMAGAAQRDRAPHDAGGGPSGSGHRFWDRTIRRRSGRGAVVEETIYRSLFVQARGVLKKELLGHLRSKRTIRRSKQAGLNGDRGGQIKDTVSIQATTGSG